MLSLFNTLQVVVSDFAALFAFPSAVNQPLESINVHIRIRQWCGERICYRPQGKEMFSHTCVILLTIGLTATRPLLMLGGYSVTAWSVRILMECFLVSDIALTPPGTHTHDSAILTSILCVRILAVNATQKPAGPSAWTPWPGRWSPGLGSSMPRVAISSHGVVAADKPTYRINTTRSGRVHLWRLESSLTRTDGSRVGANHCIP